MTDFRKGLLLGIGMVVVFGTFVASTTNNRKDYIVQKVDDEKGIISFVHYTKDRYSKRKSEVYKIGKIAVFDVYDNGDIMVLSKEMTMNIKDDTAIIKEWLGDDCIEIMDYGTNQYGRKALFKKGYTNSRGRSITEAECEKY